MKFSHNPQFDQEFDRIPGIVWYPYVGQRFPHCPQKLMVFAHNAPATEKEYERRKSHYEKRSMWNECIEDYTYQRGWWTEAFRFFLKGAVGLRENYGPSSDPAVIDRVDRFVDRIAWINFVQGMVQSERARTLAKPEQVERSKRINREILEILQITHCICWGKPVFEYVSAIEGNRVLTNENLDQAGFGYRLIQNGRGRRMHLLKVYHPSMPRYKPYSSKTQDIVTAFLARPNP